MKKWMVFIIFISLVFLSPRQIFASGDVFGSSSRFYFLASWSESVKYFFTFSKEQKINYLLELTDKRVEEMRTDPSPASFTRYQEHFQQLGELTAQVSDKQPVTEKIKNTSLRQQATLARVYNQVPDQAKEAIINAQENSSKHVATTVEDVEGPQKAQEYAQQVAQIQRAERAGQIEQVPMEGSPNVDPGVFTPKELNSINEQNQPNPLNPGSENAAGGGGGQVQPVQPIQMNQPPSQN